MDCRVGVHDVPGSVRVCPYVVRCRPAHDPGEGWGDRLPWPASILTGVNNSPGWFVVAVEGSFDRDVYRVRTGRSVVILLTERLLILGRLRLPCWSSSCWSSCTAAAAADPAAVASEPSRVVLPPLGAG
jgi:hypothetical protein